MTADDTGGCVQGAQICQAGVVCTSCAYVLGIVIYTVAAGGGNTDYYGGWADVPAFTEAPYVCMRRGVGGEFGCAQRWRAFDGNCYKFVNHLSNWRFASMDCGIQTSSLVTIESSAQNDFVRDLCESEHAEFCHIGLFQPGGGEGKYDWLWLENRQRPDWTNWWGDEPNQYEGREEDVAVILTSYYKTGYGPWEVALAVVVTLILVVVCSCVSVMAFAGYRDDNRCCVVGSAIGNGICGGILLGAVLGAVAEWNLYGAAMNLLVGSTMVGSSVCACVLCSQAATPKTVPHSPLEGMVVGQPLERGDNEILK